MKIWRLNFELEEYDNLVQVKDFDLDEIQSFDGRSKVEQWKQIAVKKMENKEFSNAPGFSSHIPVFDKVALGVLRDLIKGNTEVLPLLCVDGEFYAINVTKVLDAIDYDKAEYKTFRDGKRIMRFIRYEFIEEKVMGNHIFKITDEPLSRPFVSDEFKQRVLDNNLTGFKFELVWNSES